MVARLVDNYKLCCTQLAMKINLCIASVNAFNVIKLLCYSSWRYVILCNAWSSKQRKFIIKPRS